MHFTIIVTIMTIIIILQHDCRDTVMYALRIIDPEGTFARAKHRIIRRVYIRKIFNIAIAMIIRPYINLLSDYP